MFRDWSYKRKNIGLMLTTCLLLFFGYFSAIRQTIDVYNENQELRASLDNIDQIEKRLANLTRRKQRLDSLISQLDIGGEDQQLLKQLSSINIKDNVLTRYTEQTQRSTGNQFSTFRYEGSFQSLLRLLHQVEQRQYGGTVASAKFEVVSDRRTKVSRLFLEMYFSK